ncbi:hypothetical protein [Methanosarcina mazei]|uniref:Uncharacterized protein n=1 Tax=Methanosarcina mazei TaxID=2209 RepID=A0A0F8Q1D3_METMZ|nr:hypothetical protein [Methanosarcina mazei]KKH68748.1 hypothetical protein DU75_10650 [Methanosarcina mazei]
MNNYSNMSGFSFKNSIESLKLEEARRKMGTSATNSYNMGMTSSTGTSTMGMTNNTMSGVNMTSYSSVPSLTNSTSTGYSEIQKAKQQMNQFS